MKGMIIIGILSTIAIIALKYYRTRDWRVVLISLGAFATILTLSGLGAMTRSVIPLFIAHFVLIVIAWGTLLLYIFRGKLYWQIILSPSITILLFVIMEQLIGARG
jgi:hypothetical protein